MGDSPEPLWVESSTTRWRRISTLRPTGTNRWSRNAIPLRSCMPGH